SVREHAEEVGLMRAVTDHLAGMTDRYAGDEYRRLFDPHALT
ncbi:MAG: deoxyguanosinetriphosphate triphosphohydrolase, partial [Deinococcota bacterium]|nr:deoxyguanosinetriphosphate triphosphohydrolase [Deinococcota bacterium]